MVKGFFQILVEHQIFGERNNSQKKRLVVSKGSYLTTMNRAGKQVPALAPWNLPLLIIKIQYEGEFCLDKYNEVKVWTLHVLVHVHLGLPLYPALSGINHQ